MSKRLLIVDDEPSLWRTFGAGGLTTRVDVKDGGTIGKLRETFSRMARKISQHEEELKMLDRLKSEFVSSVSHELSAPLITIRL